MGRSQRLSSGEHLVRIVRSSRWIHYKQTGSKMTAHIPSHFRGTAALLCSALALTVAAPAFADDCNGNSIDDCDEINAGAADTDNDGMLDLCEQAKGDFDLNGVVDAADLSVFLAVWGTTTTPPGACGPAVPAWATLLEGAPDPAVVQDESLRAAIAATTLAWRVKDTATQMEFVLIPPGTYSMGCSASASLPCDSSENPVHSVNITQPFYMSRYEVTQAQWSAAMGSNPAYFIGYADSPSHPVEKVSWNMIQGFLTSTGMRLPTEAEWEYAYRAGTTTAFHSMPWYPSGTNTDSQLGQIAWYSSNAGSQTHAVGQKAGNGFGLHDMSGNVFEWVKDWDSSSYYSSSPANDPQGPVSGSTRVFRGGGWTDDSGFCRASDRNNISSGAAFYSIGFRAARTP